MVGLINKKNSTASVEKLLNLFSNQNKNLNTNNIHWKKFEELFLSNIKKNYFEHNLFNKLFSYKFKPSFLHEISELECNLLSLKIRNAYKVVFINGKYSSNLSDEFNDVWKMDINNRKLFYNPIKSELFLHLTESLNQEFVTFTLKENVVANQPLYILHINQGSHNQNDLISLYYRHHICIKDNSYGDVIEHFVSVDSEKYFNGTRTTIMVNCGSKLKYTKLSLENKNSYNFSHNDIKIDTYATVYINTFIFGSALHRHHNSIQFNGKKSNLYIDSLVLSSGNTESSIINYLEHNKEDCFSRQLHKSIIKDKARFTFDGLIKVSNQALKTDSKMLNKNLLIDSSSKVNIRPKLEIYADDISCSHGATVGKIDEEQIFYLRSRGIVSFEAKKMLILAFTEETINKIEFIDIKDIISKYVNNIK